MFSKKIILAIIVFIILVGGTVGWKVWQTYYLQTFNNNGEIVSAVPLNPKLYIDTDNDGLKDWEETLWKTDLQNPDTDGDGTNDFEEVRAGRDPLKPGPDDLLSKEELDKKTNESLESDLTETDKFSRMFLAQYIASKNNGDYKEGDYNKLVSLLNKPIDGDEMFKKTTSDFKVVPSSNENIKKYANTMALIIKNGQKKYPASELIELQKIENKDGNNFNIENIKQASERYAYIADELTLIETPSDLLINHTKIVNLLYILSTSVASMEFYLTDPAKILSQISLYPNSLEILDNTINELKEYFKEKNIKFSTVDDGYIYFGEL